MLSLRGRSCFKFGRQCRAQTEPGRVQVVPCSVAHGSSGQRVAAAIEFCGVSAGNLASTATIVCHKPKHFGVQCAYESGCRSVRNAVQDD